MIPAIYAGIEDEQFSERKVSSAALSLDLLGWGETPRELLESLLDHLAALIQER